jgi:PAS domain-containing protein
MTHLMEVWNLWHGNYWLAGVIKAMTAAASVPTAVLLARLMPEAVELPTFGQWIKANAALKAEILERKDAEVSLRIRETSFREQAELLDLTHDAIFVRSLEGKILYWNRGAERLYGWTRDASGERSPTKSWRQDFRSPWRRSWLVLSSPVRGRGNSHTAARTARR